MTMALQSYFVSLSNRYDDQIQLNIKIVDDTARVETDLCRHTRESPPRLSSFQRKQHRQQQQQQQTAEQEEEHDCTPAHLPSTQHRPLLGRMDYHRAEAISPRSLRWGASMAAAGQPQIQTTRAIKDWPLEKAVRMESPLLSPRARKCLLPPAPSPSRSIDSGSSDSESSSFMSPPLSRISSSSSPRRGNSIQQDQQQGIRKPAEDKMPSPTRLHLRPRGRRTPNHQALYPSPCSSPEQDDEEEKQHRHAKDWVYRVDAVIEEFTI